MDFIALLQLKSLIKLGKINLEEKKDSEMLLLMTDYQMGLLGTGPGAQRVPNQIQVWQQNSSASLKASYHIFIPYLYSIK